MSVEATQLNVFPTHFILDGELVNPAVQGNGNGASFYSAQQMRFLGNQPAVSLPENKFLHQPAVCESVQGKTSVNTDSGLTYNLPVSRKRDSFTQFHATPKFVAAAPPQKCHGLSQMPSLAGDDILPQIQQYQFDIDAIISQHTKKIRLELEERQKHQARLLAAAIGEGVMKKLKEKDEQIQRIGKLNLLIQERVKSLYLENQLWRDLAQTNEATANSLRTNLEQVLQHVSVDEPISAGAVVVAEDVESCCGSTNGAGDDKDEGNSACYSDRRCRMCKDRESTVLFLPCRHLCLCNVCGSRSQQLQSCPVCNASMTGTLHVNMS